MEKRKELHNLLLQIFGEKNVELLRYGIENDIPVHITGEQGTGKSFFVDYMQELAENKGIKLKLTEPATLCCLENFPEEEAVNVYWDYVPLKFNGIVIRTAGAPFHRSAEVIELFTVYADAVHEYFFSSRCPECEKPTRKNNLKGTAISLRGKEEK